MKSLNTEALKKFCGRCTGCAEQGSLDDPKICPYMTETEKESFYTEEL